MWKIIHGVLPQSSLHISYSDTEVTTFSLYRVTMWYEDGKITAPHEHMHKQTKYTVLEHHTPHKIESWSWYTKHLKHYQLVPSCTGYCYIARMHAHVCTHTNTHSQTPIQCHPHLVIMKVCKQKFPVIQYFNSPPPSPHCHKQWWTNHGGNVLRFDCM